MKKLNWKIYLGFILILSALAAIVGCSANSPSATISPATTTPPASSPVDVQSVANPIVENILVALNNNDYAAFSRDLSQNAKKILTQTSFDQLYNQMNSANGEYQSKAYFNSSVKNSVITAVYIAKYSKEPAGVFVTVVLQPANTAYQVEGLNFDSSNLRGQPLDANTLKSYADPETENILASLNNNDYTGFSKDLDQAMKKVFTQQSFDQLHNQIKSAVGDYQSKEFRAAMVQNNVTTAIYLSRYSSEPAGVWVSISFDNDKKVAGLYFSSPNLQQAQTK